MAFDRERSRVTSALHRRVDASGAVPVVTPLYQSSAFQQGSEYFYSRLNNPNTQEFEDVVCTLEGARYGIATCTGMAAISLVASLLRPGDTVVLNTLVYGCTFRFFERLALARGLDIVTLDLTTAAGINAIPAGVALVFFETPTNPFLRTVSIRDVVEQARSRSPKSLVVVDNTWATPLHQRPLEHGADISLHSATKYFSGHSDVMGGIVLTDRDDLAGALRDERFYCGSTLDPHSSWLLCRSLQTLAVRMSRHEESTSLVADFLAESPGIGTVFQPAIDGSQLTGYGGIIFVTLAPPVQHMYTAFADALELFSTGTGMAAVTSMVAQPCSGSHASLNAAEQQSMGIGPDLVRICIGMEDPDDLVADLDQALNQIAGLADHGQAVPAMPPSEPPVSMPKSQSAAARKNAVESNASAGE